MLSAEFNSYWTQNIPDSWIWLHQNEQWRDMDIIFLSVYTSLFGRPRSSDQCLDLLPWQYLYQNQDQNILHLPAQSSKRFSSLQNEKRGRERRGQERRKCDYYTLYVKERERVERTWALKKTVVTARLIKLWYWTTMRNTLRNFLALYHIFKNDFKMNNCNCLQGRVLCKHCSTFILQ